MQESTPSRVAQKAPLPLQQFWMRFSVACLASAVAANVAFFFGLIPIYDVADWIGATLLVLAWLLPVGWIFLCEARLPGGLRGITIGRLAFVSASFALVTVVLAVTLPLAALVLYYVVMAWIGHA